MLAFCICSLFSDASEIEGSEVITVLFHFALHTLCVSKTMHKTSVTSCTRMQNTVTKVISKTLHVISDSSVVGDYDCKMSREFLRLFFFCDGCS